MVVLGGEAKEVEEMGTRLAYDDGVLRPVQPATVVGSQD